MPVYLDLFGSYAKGHQAGQAAAIRRQDYILRQTKGWLDLQAKYRFTINPNDLKPPQLPDNPFFRKQQRDIVRELTVRLKGIRKSGGSGRSAGRDGLASYNRYAEIGRGLLQGQAEKRTELFTLGEPVPQEKFAKSLAEAEAALAPQPVAPDTPDRTLPPDGFRSAPPVDAGSPFADTIGSRPMDVPPVPPGLGYQPPGAGYLPPQDVAPVADTLPTQFVGQDVTLPPEETGTANADELRRWLMGDGGKKDGGSGK